MDATTTNRIVSQDQEWQLVKEGNVDAFEVIYHRHYADLMRVSYRYLADESTAKDIVQDVFLSIWEKRAKIQIRGSIRSYLITSCRNASLNHLKRKASTWQELDARDAMESSTAAPDQRLEGEDMKDLIQLALDRLPPRCRTVFLLKREEGLSLREIAEQLDISPKTVENQMTRALKSLAISLAKHVTILLILYPAIGEILHKIV